MDGRASNDQSARTTSRRKKLLYLLAAVAYLFFSFVLESATGIPATITLRVGGAAVCLIFIRELESYYPGERWVRISFWTAMVVNIAIFFTPLVDHPLSRGDLMIFAAPDAVVVLATRIFTYSVTDVHKRANRQTMILGLVVAVAISAFLFFASLMDTHTPPID